MREPLPIRFTKAAERQITDAATRWKQERPMSRDLLRERIKSTLQLLAIAPNIGPRARSTRLASVRRVRLQRVPYMVYFRIAERPHAYVEVVAVWHIHRGTPPPF